MWPTNQHEKPLNSFNLVIPINGIHLVKHLRIKHHYSLSGKTVNTGENVWNVYCFETNQMRDETAKDNRQMAAWISHDLTLETTRWLFLPRQILNFTVFERESTIFTALRRTVQLCLPSWEGPKFEIQN